MQLTNIVTIPCEQFPVAQDALERSRFPRGTFSFDHLVDCAADTCNFDVGHATKYAPVRHAPLAARICHAALFASKCARAFFPALTASAMLLKKTGELSTGPHRPAQ
jgi:hypothetical protein